MKGIERFFSVEHANERFQELDSGFFTRLKNRIVAGAKWFIPGLIAGAAIGGIGGLLYYIENREQPPRIREILSTREYQEFTLDDFVNLPRKEKQNIVYSILPAIEFAKRKLPEIERSDRFPDVKEMSRKAQKEHKMDPRLVSSWLRACYLAHDFLEEGYEKEKENRIGVSFVPKGFAQWAHTNASGGSYVMAVNPENLNDKDNISRGVLYLKECLGKDSAANTFSRYFSQSEEIATARIKTGTLDYYIGEDVSDKGPVVFRGAAIRNAPTRTGYGFHIPEHQKRATDLASALYLLTDEQGDIDLSKTLKDLKLVNGYDYQSKNWD